MLLLQFTEARGSVVCACADSAVSGCPQFRFPLTAAPHGAKKIWKESKTHNVN
jgi:hypothetical protein